MTKVVRHLRHNAVAYVALFVALGGTSYAAISLPKNSIGSRQIRNHSIDPVKLNGSSIGGYVRDWAQIDSSGHVIASRPRGATILGWNASPNTTLIGGGITWNQSIPNACLPMISPVLLPDAGPGVPASVSANLVPGKNGHPFAQVLESQPTTVNLVIICPIS